MSVTGQQAGLGSQCRLPGLGVGIASSIVRTSTMTSDLSTHCGRSAFQLLRDRSQRAVAGDAAGDVLSFGQRENPPRTTMRDWRNATVTLQQKAHDHMVFAHRT